jgi:hypothetical protein
MPFRLFFSLVKLALFARDYRELAFVYANINLKDDLKNT